MAFHKEKWKMFGFILSFRAKKKKNIFSYLEKICKIDVLV